MIVEGKLSVKEEAQVSLYWFGLKNASAHRSEVKTGTGVGMLSSEVE